MPTTTAHGIVIPAAGTEPADLYGVATRLGNSVETAIAPTAWTAPTFTNSWVNYGGGTYGNAQYRKVGDEVQLRGLVKDGTLASIFTLPTGFRPPVAMHFIVDANVGLAEIIVGTAGTVSVNVYKASGTNAYVALNQIRFSVTA